MCREHPGPRCSHGGRLRLGRAKKHLALTQQKYDNEMAKNGKVSARTQKQLDNSRRRHDAALRVYEATPESVRKIQEEIDQLQHRLSVLPRGEKGSAESREYKKTQRDAHNAILRRDQGIQARKDQYADFHMTAEERRLTRRYVQAQGGGVNKRAQPATQGEIDIILAKERGEALKIKQWPEEAFDRANTWVEKGTKTSWEENPNIRPPKGAEGERVIPSTSKLVRLNTPDGQIVEGRADVHVTKNSKGEYVVSERITVASSWEDATPIDVTTQEVGHIIASKRGFNRKAQDEITKFKTEKEAVAHANKIRRSVNQTFVKDTAKLGREAFVGRAQKPHVKLMNRGFLLYPRYKG